MSLPVVIVVVVVVGVVGEGGRDFSVFIADARDHDGLGLALFGRQQTTNAATTPLSIL